MTVRELNRDQLDQLKHNIFYDYRYDEGKRQEMADCLTEDEGEFLLTTDIYWWEIPNELVFKVYEGIHFVEEDFFYGKEE